MILDHRGEPYPDDTPTPMGYGFVASYPVAPRPKPAQLSDDGLKDAIGSEIEHYEDDHNPENA